MAQKQWSEGRIFQIYEVSDWKNAIKVQKYTVAFHGQREG